MPGAPAGEPAPPESPATTGDPAPPQGAAGEPSQPGGPAAGLAVPHAGRSRPDASMSLLVDLMANAVDQGYAEAAARRKAAGAPAGDGQTSRSRVALLAAMLCAGVLFTGAAANARIDKPSAQRTRAMLVAEAQEREGARAELADRADRLRREVAAAQAAGLAASARGEAEARRLAVLELATAAVPVVGPGLRVSISDPTDSPESVDSRVLDRDVQLLANGLWAAGAEAVAVNGQRLTTTSAIRTAGSTILVNFRPITSPYVLEAVGDPRTLHARFAETAAASRLETYSSVYGFGFSVLPVDAVHLPAAPVLALRSSSVPPAQVRR